MGSSIMFFDDRANNMEGKMAKTKCRFMVSIYNGMGVESGGTRQLKSTTSHEARREARQIAEKKWDDVVRLAVIESQERAIVSFGPRDGDKWLSLHRCSE